MNHSSATRDHSSEIPSYYGRDNVHLQKKREMERYAVILLAMIMKTTTIAEAQQLEVSGGLLTSSRFEDSDNNGYGKGSMQQYKPNCKMVG